MILTDPTGMPRFVDIIWVATETLTQNRQPQRVVVAFLLFPSGTEAVLFFDLRTCPAGAWDMEHTNLLPAEFEIQKPKVDERPLSCNDNSLLLAYTYASTTATGWEDLVKGCGDRF
jgi:hypothetical protein